MSSQFEEYRTGEGEMVDAIAFNRFGTSRGMTEAILDANPGLAATGEIIPTGTIVRIPVPEVKDRTTVRRLWD
jgi:phage tail protein X